MDTNTKTQDHAQACCYLEGHPNPHLPDFRSAKHMGIALCAGPREAPPRPVPLPAWPYSRIAGHGPGGVQRPHSSDAWRGPAQARSNRSPWLLPGKPASAQSTPRGKWGQRGWGGFKNPAPRLISLGINAHGRAFVPHRTPPRRSIHPRACGGFLTRAADRTPPGRLKRPSIAIQQSPLAIVHAALN